jgi:hypothetical protein
VARPRLLQILRGVSTATSDVDIRLNAIEIVQPFSVLSRLDFWVAEFLRIQMSMQTIAKLMSSDVLRHLLRMQSTPFDLGKH